MGGRISCLTSLLQHPFHRRREIQDEMEPIGYLLRLRRSQCCAFGIQTATITRDRDDFGMLSEPCGEALGGPVRKKVHDAVQVQINQNGSIVLAFAPGPIVDAEVVNGKCGWLPHRFLPNTAQNGVITGSNR